MKKIKLKKSAYVIFALAAVIVIAVLLKVSGVFSAKTADEDQEESTSQLVVEGDGDVEIIIDEDEESVGE